MKIHIDQTDSTGVTLAQNGSGNTYSAVVVFEDGNSYVRVPVVISAESTKTTNGIRRTMLKVTLKIPKDLQYNPANGAVASLNGNSGTEEETFHTVLTTGRTFDGLRALVGPGSVFADKFLRFMVGTMVSLIASNKSVSEIGVGDGSGAPGLSFTPFTRAMDEQWPLDGTATYGNETVP